MKLLTGLTVLFLAVAARAECNHEFCIEGGAHSPDVPGALLYHTSFPVLYLENIEATPNRWALVLYNLDGGVHFGRYPFAGGNLCLNHPIQRTVPVRGSASGGAFSLDWSQWKTGALGGKPDPLLLLPGHEIYMQWVVFEGSQSWISSGLRLPTECT